MSIPNSFVYELPPRYLDAARISPMENRCTKIVHWKDQKSYVDSDVYGCIDTSSLDDDTNTNKIIIAKPENEKAMPPLTPKYLAFPTHASASTKSLHVKSAENKKKGKWSRSEVKQLLRRQQHAIRRACALELDLLNKCAAIRVKRKRMVDQVQRLQRKLGDTKVFVAPPDLKQTSFF